MEVSLESFFSSSTLSHSPLLSAWGYTGCFTRLTQRTVKQLFKQRHACGSSLYLGFHKRKKPVATVTDSLWRVCRGRVEESAEKKKRESVCQCVHVWRVGVRFLSFSFISRGRQTETDSFLLGTKKTSVCYNHGLLPYGVCACVCVCLCVHTHMHVLL